MYVIGDIHGCYNTLMALVAIIPDFEQNQVLFLGDYIDRGSNSKAVVEQMIVWKRQHPEWIFLRGNHEQLCLDFTDKPSIINEGDWRANGGRATLASFGGEIPASAITFMRECFLYYETSDYFFVHAGIDPSLLMENQTADDYLWVRDKFMKYHGPLPKRIVFGHTALKHVLITPYRIGLDTGCVYGNQLTAIELPSERIYAVNSIR